MRYQFINDNREHYDMDEMRDALEVNRSGYYDWKKRNESTRSLEDAVIKKEIRKVYKLAGGRYGHRPIYHHL